jgi:hypothetical protein
MEKVCIFCGERPESRNLEHVLPRWLIELTGNPKRRARFGYKKSVDGKFAERRFSFDAFKFPSCRECNQKFGELEAGAKVIVREMMSADCVSESELSTLLDWFDKVRIGLWLGYLYLDGNPLGISPHFHVEHRMRQHDRMLGIFRADGDIRNLTCFGCDSPAFAQTPSCFSLSINNLVFFNVSHPFLLARRMGFPFPRESYMMEDGRLYCSLGEGRKRIMRPVLRKPISIEGVELYQPIFTGSISCEGDERAKRLYASKYVRDNCISWQEGIGRIYIKRDSRVSAYSGCPSMEWWPERPHKPADLFFDIQRVTLEWQLYIMKNLAPSGRLLTVEKKRQLAKLRGLGRYYNREVMAVLEKARRR